MYDFGDNKIVNSSSKVVKIIRSQLNIIRTRFYSKQNISKPVESK